MLAPVGPGQCCGWHASAKRRALQGKLLASAALSYVAAVLAQSMGFTQLFFALKAKARPFPFRLVSRHCQPPEYAEYARHHRHAVLSVRPHPSVLRRVGCALCGRHATQREMRPAQQRAVGVKKAVWCG